MYNEQHDAHDLNCQSLGCRVFHPLEGLKPLNLNVVSVRKVPPPQLP